ncbi:aminoglycoside phosphotransferase family protein, partial [Desulfovibrio sp. XJ01]|nr:aminoglycoside phosphotransferase family protein [Nitratidesulfovibrio liaohensis]
MHTAAMVAEFLGRMILQREGDGAGALSGALSGSMPDSVSGSTPGFPLAVPDEADADTPRAWAAALGVPLP